MTLSRKKDTTACSYHYPTIVIVNRSCLLQSILSQSFNNNGLLSNMN